MSAPSFRVFLTHVSGEGPFIYAWVQEKDEDVTEIKNLLTNFSKVFEAGFGDVQTVSAEQNVCAKYNDTWYRGKVICPNESSALIHLIDYGYTNEIPLSDIKSLEKLSGTPLQNIPPLATKFIIAGVISASHEWNTEMLDSMCKNFCSRPMMASVACVNQYAKFAYLSLPGTTNYINSVLVNCKYGVPISINDQSKLAMRYYTPMTASALEAKLIQPEETPQFPTPVPPADPRFRKANVFTIGSQHEIFVSSVDEGPYCFSVQLQSQEQELNALMTQLNMQELQPLAEMPLPGTGCAAKFLRDEAVCRAIIMQTNSEDTCKVLYIDYGTKELALPYKNLFQLPFKFQLCSPMATSFSLRGIKELPNFPKIKDWFIELVCEKTLTMVVTPQEGPSKLRQQCDLFVNNNSVLEMLKDKLSEEGSKYSREMVAENTQHQVTVTYVDDSGVLPWTFCVQLQENAKKLESVMQKLGVYCQSVPAIEPGEPGDAIFAMFTDGGWYRGSFVGYQGNNRAIVEYVDYGNAEELDLHKLRPALPELVSELPAQAIKCRLQSADTIDDVTSKFAEMTDSKILNLQVVKVFASGEVLVKLFDSSTCPVTDLARELFLGSLQHDAITSQALSAARPSITEDGAGTDVKPKSECELKTMNKTKTNPAIMRSVSKMDERWNERKPPAFNSDKVEEARKWEHDKYGEDNYDKRSSDNMENKWNAKPNTEVRQRDEHRQRHDTRDDDRAWGNKNENSRGGRNRDDRYNGKDDRYSSRDKRTDDWSNTRQTRNNWEDDKRNRKPVEVESWEDTTDFRQQEVSQPAPRSFTSKGRDDNFGFKNSNNGTSKVGFSKEADDWEEQTPPPPKVHLKPQTLSPSKDKTTVFVTFMTTPSDFYVQLESHLEELQSLMDKIVVMCEAGGSAADVPSGYLKPGDACLAKYTEDDLWYRAQVMSVNGDKVKVKLVDYGNVLEVDVKGQVKYASAELVKLPSQGIYCSLRGAKPSVGDAWGQQELLDFTAAVEDRTLKLDVMGLEGLCLIQYSVVLYDGLECVNTKLGATPDSLLPCNELVKCEPLSEGSEHKALFSWFITPDNFHVILQDRIKERDIMYAEFTGMECPPLKLLEPGTLVLASKNNAYFRASVLATKGTKIRVTNLDVGNIQVCESDKVLMMPESLKQTPGFAVHCGMFGIVPKNSQWVVNDPQVNVLLQSIPQFVLKVHGHDDEGKTLVTLQAGEVDVCEALVDKGVADFIKHQEEKLYPGLCCKVFLCYFEDLDKIYVHEVARQEELEEMQEKLQLAELCNAPNPASNLVAARKLDDDVWFRAAQLANTDEVMFVDYGIQDEAAQLFALPEEFSSFQNFATECSLAVRPPCGALTFSQQAIAMIESFADDEEVQLTAKVFAKHEGRLIIDLLVNNSTSLIESMAKEALVEPMITEAYVSYTVSPSEFYIQQVKDEEKIMEVEERLATEEFEELKEVQVGMKCLAKFTDDEALYRAEVTGEAENGAYQVHFLDYGNRAVATDLKQLPTDLESLPALCQQCSLASMPTSDEEKKKFQQEVNDGTVKLQILVLNCQQPTLQVIVLRDGKDILCTTEVTTKVVKVKSGIIESTSVITNQVAEEKKPEENKVESEKAENVVSSVIIENKNNKIGMYISHYVSANLFWYQKVEDESKIYQLQEELALVEDQFVDTVEVGCTYAAQFVEDNTWYRGTVVSLDPRIVFFMDYGNTGDATEFKVLPESLKMIPAYAHRCNLKFSPQDASVEKKLQEILSDECTVFHVDGDGILYKDEQDVLELVGYRLQDVVISCYTSPSDFLVQPISELEKLEIMQAQLAEGEDLAEVTEGMKCAAKFVEDDVWYRCIISTKQEDEIVAFFYDYGNSSVATEFKCLSKEVLETKAFAQKCHLDLKVQLSKKDEDKLSLLLGDPEGPVFQIYLNEYSETNSLQVTVMKNKTDILTLINLNSDDISSNEKIEASVCEPEESNVNKDQVIQEQTVSQSDDKYAETGAEVKEEMEIEKHVSEASDANEKEEEKMADILEVKEENDEDKNVNLVETKEVCEFPLVVTPESTEPNEPETLVHLTKAAVDLQMFKDSVCAEVEIVMNELFTSSTEIESSASIELPNTTNVEEAVSVITSPITTEVLQIVASSSDVETEECESTNDEISNAKTTPDMQTIPETDVPSDLKNEKDDFVSDEMLTKYESCEENTESEQKQTSLELPQDTVFTSVDVITAKSEETSTEKVLTKPLQSVISTPDEDKEEVIKCCEEATGGSESEDKKAEDDSEKLPEVDPEVSLYVSFSSSPEMKETVEETMYQSAISSSQTHPSSFETTAQTKSETKSDISPFVNLTNVGVDGQVCTSTPLSAEERVSPNIDVSPLNANVTTAASMQTTPVGAPKQGKPTDTCETSPSSPVEECENKPTAS